MEQSITMYDSFKIGSLTISNRLVGSAMFEFGAEEGRITNRIIERYRELAKGGAGLIISGMQAVSAGAGIAPSMVQTPYDNYEKDMRQIVDAFHENGSRIFVQLQHAGYRTAWKRGYDTCGVSEFPVSEECTYHEATQEEINEIVNNFGKAAKRCKDAGCDGVQIHAAHGFLINTFLSPYYNHRIDCYGGTIENRARLLLEVYDSIRKNVGKEYPVSVKIPFSDLVSSSLSSEESVWICKELEKRGINMIEVSSGITMDGGETSFTPFEKTGKPEGKFLEGASQIADAVSIPVVSVCGYRTPDYIEKALNSTNIAAVSFGRPLVCEPDLPNRWKTDRSKAKCRSCNGCCGSLNMITCKLNS